MSTHTPTPWAVVHSSDGRTGTHIRGGEMLSGAAVQPSICKMTVRTEGYGVMTDNAAHIVQCVNERDSLLAQIASLREALEPMTKGTHWLTDEHVAAARAALKQVTP